MYFHLRLREYKRLLHNYLVAFFTGCRITVLYFAGSTLRGRTNIFHDAAVRWKSPFISFFYQIFIHLCNCFGLIIKGPKCRACTQSPSLMVKNSAKEQSIFFLRAASSFAHSKSSFETNQAGVSPNPIKLILLTVVHSSTPSCHQNPSRGGTTYSKKPSILRPLLLLILIVYALHKEY